MRNKKKTMTRKIFLNFAFVFITFNASLFSQPNSLSYLSSTTGAACYEVFYHNNRVYTGNGNTFASYDVSQGQTPPFQELFIHRFQSNIANIQTHNGYIYVAANHDGISKWDVTNPLNPVLVAQKNTDSLSEAALDMAFKGDTVFVAYKTKVAVFRDNGNNFSLITSFAYQPANSHVKGIDAKGNLLAFITAYGTTTDGVYIYDADNLNFKSFTQQTYCDGEDVSFGTNFPLLYVCGGTNATQQLFDLNGLFYALNISNPNLPYEIFRDTLSGSLILDASFAQPMSAKVINDTVYVSCLGAAGVNYVFPNPFYTDVVVFTATSASNMQLLTGIYAGLYHFDCDIHNNTAYIASEWYGLLTVDITNIFNPIDLGKTLTGGWNTSSDVYGNKMVVGNEGYGFKVFDITDKYNPVLLDTNLAGGFCFNIRYSSNGNYIYGCYFTGNGFRVYDANTLAQVGSISGFTGMALSKVWQNKFITYKQPVLGQTQLVMIDVATPAAPTVQITKNLIVKDIALRDANGRLFVSTNDSIYVYDIANNLQRKFAKNHGIFQQFDKMAYYNDTLYCYVVNKGLTKYKYNPANDSLTEISFQILPMGTPKLMAADSYGLYLVYQTQGMFALDKNNFSQTGYYKTGLEFTPDNLWGQQEIFCNNNFIYLAEYFGQTSIFSNNPALVSVQNPEKVIEEDCIKVYPNPSAKNQKTILDFSSCDENLNVTQLSLFDNTGRKINAYWSVGNKMVSVLTDLKEGIYFYELRFSNGGAGKGKFIANQ